jgi:hypothetical protein
VVVSVTGAERVKRSLTLTREEWQVLFWSMAAGARELCQIAATPTSWRRSRCRTGWSSI